MNFWNSIYSYISHDRIWCGDSISQTSKKNESNFTQEINNSSSHCGVESRAWG